MFKRDLVADIKQETKSLFKQFLIAILECKRAVDSGTVVHEEAQDDAKVCKKLEIFTLEIMFYLISLELYLKNEQIPAH